MDSDALRRLWGRAEEVDALHDLLHDDVDHPSGMVLHGDGGIGRTALWWAAVDMAEAAGHRVLRVRASVADELLAFAGLADLLDGVDEEVLACLPAPQRRAVDSVTLRTDPSIDVEPRTVGTALSTLLRMLCAGGPVLVAVDDEPWLDRPTADALSFALRRIDHHAVRVLLTAPAIAPPGRVRQTLVDAFGTRLHERTIGPLDADSMRRILAELDRPSLPRTLVERLVAAAGGHPLLALELARGVRMLDRLPRADEPLPLPARLRDLVAARVEGLEESDRALLRLIAFASRPTVDLVLAQAGGAATLDAWEAAGLTTVDRGVVKLANQMLAVAVREGATGPQRRATHAALAALVPEVEQQARHMALADSRPDGAVADALERAATATAARGSPSAAAELAALAVARTPETDHDDRARRRLDLAALCFRLGDTDEAVGLARSVLGSPTTDDMHARALLLLGEVEFENGISEIAVAHCLSGLQLVTDDVGLQARLHAQVAAVATHDMTLALRHADRAMTLLAGMDEPDPATACMALQGRIAATLALGGGLVMEDVERAIVLEGKAPAPRVADRPSAALGAWLAWTDDVDGAKEALEATLQTARDEGDESSVPYALSHLPLTLLRLGELAEARAVAEQVLEAAEATAQDYQRCQALWMLAIIDAHLGDLDGATREAEECRVVAGAGEDPWVVRQALSTMGFVELSRGRPDAAVGHLRAAVELEERIGLRNPVLRRGAQLLADALVEVGDLTAAAVLIDDLAEAADVLDTAPTQAVCRRLRAQLAAADGRLEDALDHLEEARRYHARRPFPFDEARTMLVLGQVQRRRRQRGQAAAALQHARDGFAAIGAQGWVARVDAEMVSSAGRSRTGALTAAERRVADALLAGATVKETARRLHMSPKTVEVHITRIYRKLGIRSRAQLGAALGAADTPSQ
ncbi:LuxR C-terminal-related transcriptional regulator [Euzebya pacifica]|uniref:LuxR C-terminal-related transcriptional regulator n=1 Tax=Euzebya pacifica TaxID=1608957 RepID=UPI0030F918FA